MLILIVIFLDDKLLIPKVEPLDSIQESSAKDNVVQSFKQDFDKYEINLDQVQVKASADELNRRIESFILRKRQHVNSVNIQEFCRHRFVITIIIILISSLLKLVL